MVFWCSDCPLCTSKYRLRSIQGRNTYSKSTEKIKGQHARKIPLVRNLPANIYLFKVKNRNTIVNFEHILHLFLVFLLLTFNKQMLAGLKQKNESSQYFKRL